MFPELSSLIHDYLRPVTRADWRRLHKYKDSDLTRDLDSKFKPIYEIARLNRMDNGFMQRFKDAKYIGGMRVLFINDYIILLKGRFVYYYYIYTTETIIKDNVLYRDLDILGELYYRRFRYCDELALACLFAWLYGIWYNINNHYLYIYK